MTAQQKPRQGGDPTAARTGFDSQHCTPPIVSGQCAQVFHIIRQEGPVLSLVLTADRAIPETAARVHDLRAKGYNIITRIQPAVAFRGVVRRNVALYSLGTPEWPAPGFFAEPEAPRQRGLF